ncbi:hypothetical protein GGD64_008455 [Bradyrhizobium sp. CIR3A]|nr:hypothetical protein [Bradyrhizobium sp. CIR3A]
MASLGKMPNHFGPALNLAIEALDRSKRLAATLLMLA